MSAIWKNQLYFGDNHDILIELDHQHLEGFIDLFYNDRPSNTFKKLSKQIKNENYSTI
jgi:hypothetical protein